MSGGHWDYSQNNLRETLLHVALDPAVRRRFPITSYLLEELANVLYSTMHDLDYDLSGDRELDDAIFDKALPLRLAQSLNKKVKIKVWELRLESEESN